MRLKRALSRIRHRRHRDDHPAVQRADPQPDIANGLYDIHWLEKYLAKS